MSVTLRLEDDIDISRGDMICRPNNQPPGHPGHRGDGLLDVRRARRYARAASWPSSTRPARRAPWSRTCTYRLDVNTLHRDEDATKLELNEIGRVTLRVTQPLFADDYGRNRTTGGFILIDEATNATVGAGMIMDSR